MKYLPIIISLAVLGCTSATSEQQTNASVRVEEVPEADDVIEAFENPPFDTTLVKNLYPKIGRTYDIGEGSRKRFIEDSIKIAELLGEVSPDDEAGWISTLKLIEKIDPYWSECAAQGYLETGTGCCDFYCGSGIDTVVASSSLKATTKTTYYAKNIHDWSLATAWVEGKEDYGMGEKITFYLSQFAGIEGIVIYNGYLKNEELWKANSRVKILKVYVNDKYYANLHLQDTYKEQNFNFGEMLFPFKDERLF